MIDTNDELLLTARKMTAALIVLKRGVQIRANKNFNNIIIKAIDL